MDDLGVFNPYFWRATLLDQTSDSHAPKDSVWGLPDSPDKAPSVSASVSPTPTRLRGAVPAPSPAGKVAMAIVGDCDGENLIGRV